MAWHFDFLVDAPDLGIEKKEKREKALQQLDALAKAGLLDQSKERLTLNNETKAVIRYRLSEKGWVESRYSREELACFIYGKKRYLGIRRFEPLEGNEQANLEAYRVYARIGLQSEDDLAPWAKDEAFLQLFPEIGEKKADTEFKAVLFRGKNGWVDAELLQDEMNQKVEPKNPRYASRVRPILPQGLAGKEKEEWDEAAKLPEPTFAEAKENLLSRVEKSRAYYLCALKLPGSDRLPVDKKIFSSSPLGYSVAIFFNRERPVRDPITTKPLCLVKKLARQIPA